MTCAEYTRWFSPYVDALLGDPERRQLEDHLQGCAGCRRELDALRQMLHALHTMEQPSAPDLVPGIHEKLSPVPWWRALVQRVAAPWPASLPWHGLALAATALLVVFVVSLPRTATRGRLVQLASSRSSETPQTSTGMNERAFVGQEQRGNYDPYYLDNGKLKQKADEQNLGELHIAAELTARLVSPPALPQHEDMDRNGAFQDEVSFAKSVDEAENIASLSGWASVGKAAGLSAAASGVASSATEPQPPAAAPEEPAKFVSGAQAYVQQAAGQKSKSPHTVPTVIQATWLVADFASAAAQVEAWVGAGEGFAIATNEHHLSVKLPASRVAEFLTKCSTPAHPPMALVGGRAPTVPATQDALWVTISLELVLPQ
ncbi:MAG: zf-HC2 domain-containing protein [Candidatus Omnitrophica bacterium]|nr:zf-HC2 domain-containing protein [Candidatus Omnitrophota bacterium]